MFKVIKAFYTEAYLRVYTFSLHMNLYKTRASLFIHWHLSDPLKGSAQKYLQSVATKRIIMTFNWGKKETDCVNSINEILSTIQNQLITTCKTHTELREYLMYWRYIITEDIEVTEKVAENEINQISRFTFTLIILHSQLIAWRGVTSATPVLQNCAQQTLIMSIINSYELITYKIMKIAITLSQFRADMMNLMTELTVYRRIWEKYW